jgi:hypothetical protein
MKKIITICAAILMTANVFAQAPNKMSYQAIIRNNSNALVTNSAVGMRISILQTSPSGTTVYVETQTPTTNVNGLASLEIGGGTVVSGNFSTINWANGPYFIKTETDPNGGTSYNITGTSQLLSVPYALYSKSTGDTTLWLKNANNIYFNKGNVGVKTSTPVFPFQVNGNMYLYNRGHKLIFGSGVGLNDSTFAIYRPVGTDGIMMEANDIYIKSRITPIQLQSGSTINMMDLSGNTKMIVNPQTGRVGIGTTSPSQLLSVAGMIETTTGGVKFPDGTIQTTAATSGSSLWSSNGNSIYYNSGKVGINISNPIFPLDVNGNLILHKRGDKLIFGDGLSSSDSLCAIYRPLGDDGVLLKGMDLYLRGNGGIQLQAGNGIPFMDLNSNVKMYFNTLNGNLGIGTTTPSRTLHVNSVMRLEPIATAPSSPAKGDMYFDSTLNKLRVYDGSTWQNCW